MNTRNANFYIKRNSDFYAKVDIVGVDGELLNLDCMNFYCECSFERDETNQLMVICEADSDTGKLEMFIPKSITRELPDGDWLYKLHMEYKRDGTEYIPLEGKFILTK